MLTWDGVGLGEDGTLWGGETLYGRPGQWLRAGSLRSFRLPGGDKAGRQPWRSALSLQWELGIDGCSSDAERMLRRAWEKDLNCPRTTAAGRLFDAAAVLLGLLENASFEGQGPMLLEAAANGHRSQGPELPCCANDEGVWQIDWAPLLSYLTDAGLSIGQRAAGFHESLAGAILSQVNAISCQRKVRKVALSGGVFQNDRLASLVFECLRGEGYHPVMSKQIPVNDAGLSYGQLIEYMVTQAA